MSVASASSSLPQVTVSCGSSTSVVFKHTIEGGAEENAKGTVEGPNIRCLVWKHHAVVLPERA